MDRYSHNFLFVFLNMVSKNFPIISQQFAINFLTYKVTIATVQPLRNTLNFGFMCLQLKNESGDPRVLLLICNQHNKIHLFGKV